MKVGKVVTLSQFRGIDNVNDPSAIGENTMAEGMNVYITSKRRIRPRRGQIQRVTGNNHSVFATLDGRIMVMVRNNDLVWVNPDLSVRVLRSGLMPGMPIAFVEINGVIYYSNGVQTGRIVNGTHGLWGITNPTPVGLQVTPGVLQAGIYGVIITYKRADGQESGTSSPEALQVPANSGIQIILPVSTDPEVTEKIIYATTPDGGDYYMVAAVPNSVTSINWQGFTTDIRPFTEFYGPPPAGQALGYLSGRCLIAVGDILFFTVPYSYELVDYSETYKQLSDWIDIVAPVEDGVYLSFGDRIAFMKDRNLKTAELVGLTNYGSTPGTLVYVDHINIPGLNLPDKKVAVWSTAQGVVAGYNGGQLFNLSEDNYRPGKYRGGGALYLQRDGDRLYIASHRGSPVVGNTRPPTGIDVEIRGPI